jgi:hypothetical protein
VTRVYEKIAQNAAKLFVTIIIFSHGKKEARNFGLLLFFFIKLPQENNRPRGLNLPNLCHPETKPQW